MVVPTAVPPEKTCIRPKSVVAVSVAPLTNPDTSCSPPLLTVAPISVPPALMVSSPPELTVVELSVPPESTFMMPPLRDDVIRVGLAGRNVVRAVAAADDHA